MKSIETYIKDSVNDEIHLILQNCQIHVGDKAYDTNYERLYNDIMTSKDRNWDYEYDQYCVFMHRLNREKNYR